MVCGLKTNNNNNNNNVGYVLTQVISPAFCKQRVPEYKCINIINYITLIEVVIWIPCIRTCASTGPAKSDWRKREYFSPEADRYIPVTGTPSISLEFYFIISRWTIYMSTSCIPMRHSCNYKMSEKGTSHSISNRRYIYRWRSIYQWVMVTFLNR